LPTTDLELEKNLNLVAAAEEEKVQELTGKL
jgi:hypothetical protein